MRMKIFLGSETEGRADSLLLPVRNKVDSLLNGIREKDYGKALSDIGIFSIIMKDEMYDSGGYPERKYYRKTSGSADIRLRLNYNEFCNATQEERMELYKRDVWKAFSIAADKAKVVDCQFKKEELINDVEKMLGLFNLQESKKNNGMIIYLAGETEGKAIARFREVVQLVDPLLDEIREKNYGNALVEIGIFVIILEAGRYEAVHERRYYSNIKKCAEVKLRINYQKFVYGELEDRINMCKELILRAFEIIVEKIQKKNQEFKGEELLSDINTALGGVEKNLYWV